MAAASRCLARCDLATLSRPGELLRAHVQVERHRLNVKVQQQSANYVCSRESLGGSVEVCRSDRGFRDSRIGSMLRSPTVVAGPKVLSVNRMLCIRREGRQGGRERDSRRLFRPCASCMYVLGLDLRLVAAL